ncbi:DegV family protein [Lactococcus nasutitermitis]|uniref:DegV family protein n=1 Tax=Lactococcus nasutitermitis TaxID=1652957 RepID=A0ABV9JCF7_9LACT|nr:DegV family protein [Lactococcus nasutitermitis]
MKLAIITDTSADIAEKFRNNEHLFVLEVPISIDGIDYKPSEFSHEAWFDLMREAKDVPKTSQPSVAELSELLLKLEKENYTHVLGLFLTSGISGFYQNAFYLQNEFDRMVVKFPETYITSSPLGFMIETALNLADKGKSFEEILEKFEEQRAHDNAFMLVDDLHWLAKGGRLSRGGEILGTLLNIKPLLQFSEDGKVVVYDKVRTTKKAVNEMEKLFLEASNSEDFKVYIIHSGDEERARELYDFAKASGYEDLELVTFGPVIATHLGLGAVAYAVIPK